VKCFTGCVGFGEVCEFVIYFFACMKLRLWLGIISFCVVLGTREVNHRGLHGSGSELLCGPWSPFLYSVLVGLISCFLSIIGDRYVAVTVLPLYIVLLLSEFEKRILLGQYLLKADS
jgi:hypothetical protein